MRKRPIEQISDIAVNDELLAHEATSHAMRYYPNIEYIPGFVEDINRWKIFKRKI